MHDETAIPTPAPLVDFSDEEWDSATRRLEGDEFMERSRELLRDQLEWIRSL